MTTKQKYRYLKNWEDYDLSNLTPKKQKNVESEEVLLIGVGQKSPNSYK